VTVQNKCRVNKYQQYSSANNDKPVSQIAWSTILMSMKFGTEGISTWIAFSCLNSTSLYSILDDPSTGTPIVSGNPPSQQSLSSSLLGSDLYSSSNTSSEVLGPYNTPGVWLPHLHLHFISTSIIHLIYAIVELEH
jgi:hypothetical protein